MEFSHILKSLKKRKAFSTLILLQIALTLTVMSISVLITQATLKEWNLPSGLDQENIIAIYPQIFDESVNLKETVTNDLQRLAAIPGVTQVTTTDQIPFGAERLTSVTLEDKKDAQTFQTSIFDLNESGFAVLGIKLLAGRTIQATDVVYQNGSDNQSPAVVMVSQQMAEAMFGNTNVVGRSIYLQKDEPPVTIIGVYSNFMNGERLNWVGQSYRSIIRPRVKYTEGSDPNYLLRVEPGKTDAFLETLLNSLYQTQGRYIQQVEFLTRTQKRMYDGRGSRALLMLCISFILLIITGFGIAGLISFLVAKQKKQIGIRRALGAKRWQIIRYYLVENSIITGIGLIFGLILTTVLLIIMAKETNQSVFHAGWMVGITLFIWLVSLLSALSPARKAAMVAPAIVTRGS